MFLFSFIADAEQILWDIRDEELGFFLKMEKSSLSEELWKEFPSLCDAVREAELLPKCELEVNGRASCVSLFKKTFE